MKKQTLFSKMLTQRIGRRKGRRQSLMAAFALMLLAGTAANAQQPERLQVGTTMQQEPLNPLAYGLRDAKDGKERFEVLRACHKDAVDYGRPISYDGIDTIRLEIPDGAETIPLPNHTDFAGVVILVRNDSGKDITLFALTGEKPKAVAVDRRLIDSGDFRSVADFQAGDYLLIVEDKNKWTFRDGYGYEVYRRDLLYVSDGHSLNRPVASYMNPAANPVCSFVPVTVEQKVIENVTIHRGRNEKHKTYCFSVSYQNNVVLRNMHITTPKTKFNGDAAISINNSANCTVQDVLVDSTYSYPGAYGYAIGMNNVWNTTFVRFKADAAWGVFGSNNVSNITLRECDVNRFDIHCYGRDARLVNCTFRNKQTQFSSMYGQVVFDSCHFIDCIPVRIRSSYNAYTPFDIYFRHCTFDATLRHHALVNVMLLSTTRNPRPELSARCWPNVFVEDLTVNLPFLTRRIEIIEPTGTLSECKKPVDYIETIEINGLKTLRNGRSERCDLYFTKHRFSTSGLFRVNFKDVNINGGRMVNMINDR